VRERKKVQRAGALTIERTALGSKGPPCTNAKTQGGGTKERKKLKVWVPKPIALKKKKTPRLPKAGGNEKHIHVAKLCGLKWDKAR